MFCPKCGEILPDSAKTCRVCGASLGASQEKKPGAKPSYQRPDHGETDHAAHQHHFGGEGKQRCYTTFQRKTTYQQQTTFTRGGKPDAREAMRRFFQGYRDFKGRSGRWEFIWPLALLGFGSVLVATVFTSLAVVWFLGLASPFCALTARRLHDVGMDGRWGLLLLAPMMGPLLLIVLCVKPSGPENRWGPVPETQV